MKRKIKCPKCGSENVEPYKHSAVGASKDSEKPSANGPMVHECGDCGYQFIEDDLKEN